jgi:hypothetical protein
MQRDEFLDDGETYAEPRPHDFGFGLEEGLEQVLEFGGRDAFAGIAHLHRDQVVLGHHLHADLAAPRRELQRVRQQIGDDLLDTLGVADDGHLGINRGVRHQ